MKILSDSSNETGLAPTLLAVGVLLMVSVAALWQATMGFNAISTEDGRRLAVARQAVTLPAAAIHAPQADTLAHLLAGDGRVALVSFMYSRCNTVCSVLGSEFQQLQQAIRQRHLQHDVRLISISFDAADTPLVLTEYARRLGADPPIWRMVSIDQETQRTALLATFGVVVLPEANGEYQHNVAFHLLDRQGRLVRIMDIDDPLTALEQAAALAQGTRHVAPL